MTLRAQFRDDPAPLRAASAVSSDFSISRSPTASSVGPSTLSPDMISPAGDQCFKRRHTATASPTEEQRVFDNSPLPHPPTSSHHKRTSADGFNSSEDDEVVGVTAEGELLFRRRRSDFCGRGPTTGAIGGVPRHGPQARPQDNRVRPTPRTVTVARVAPPRQALVRQPIQVSASHHDAGTHVESDVVPENVRRLEMLALRCRDKENDVYQAYAQEEFRRFNLSFQAQQRDAILETMERRPLRHLR